MFEKELIINIYDLIAKNTEYQPREYLDYILDNEIEDYSVNYGENENPRIEFYDKKGGEYWLELHKAY